MFLNIFICVYLHTLNSSNECIHIALYSFLKYVRIYFDTTTFDRITMDDAAKFVDKVSAIGGNMGLLTGFSIISAVEILFFLIKTIWTKMNLCGKMLNTKWNVHVQHVHVVCFMLFCYLKSKCILQLNVMYNKQL